MKVAVIGCGKQGRRHLAAFAGLPGVTGLVAADGDPARARAAPAAAIAVDDVFADPAIDAVVIATPTLFHVPLARRAIASGKHVLCEKPFGADATAAHALARDAAAAGLVGRVGYLYRFAPAIVAARAAVAGLGTIESARFVVAAPGDHAAWKHRLAEGGGAVNELASHMVDLAIRFFGAPPGCTVLEKSQRRERRTIGGVSMAVDAEDRIAVRLGDRIVVEADFAAPRFAHSIEIRGARGVVRASIDGSPDLYAAQARAFHDAIQGVAAGHGADFADAARANDVLDMMRHAPRSVAAA